LICSFLLARGHFSKEEEKFQSQEVSQWINDQLLDQSATSPDTLCQDLANGLQLCRLFEQLSSLKLKYHVNAEPQTFLARENINVVFSTACRSIGLAGITILFAPFNFTHSINSCYLHIPFLCFCY
jgi:hypothetical protein